MFHLRSNVSWENNVIAGLLNLMTKVEKEGFGYLEFLT